MHKSKSLEATLLFIDFSKAFDSKHRGKMDHILLAYILLSEIVTAIKMLYKITKARICSSDGDTDFFNIVTCVFNEMHLYHYRNSSSVKIRENSLNIPGDLRFAFSETSMKYLQLKLMWKTRENSLNIPGDLRFALTETSMKYLQLKLMWKSRNNNNNNTSIMWW